MVSRLFFLFLVFLGEVSQAFRQCPRICQASGAVTISTRGAAKIAINAFNANKKDLEQNIMSHPVVDQLGLPLFDTNGQPLREPNTLVDFNYTTPAKCTQKYIARLSTQAAFIECPGLPPMDENGAVVVYSHGGVPDSLKPRRTEMTTSNFEIRKIDLQVPKPPTCDVTGLCKISITAHHLEVEGNVDISTFDKKGKKIPWSNSQRVKLSLDDVVYNFTTKIDPQSGKLSDLVQVEDESSRVVIPPQSNMLTIVPPNGKTFEDIRRAAMETYYDKVRSLLPANQRGLMPVIRGPSSAAEKKRERIISKLPDSILQDAQIQNEAGRAFTASLAKSYNFPTPGALNWFGGIGNGVNALMTNSKFTKQLATKVRSQLHFLDENVNAGLAYVPSAIDYYSQLPAPAAQDIILAEEAGDSLRQAQEHLAQLKTQNAGTSAVAQAQAAVDRAQKKSDEMQTRLTTAFSQINLNVVAQRAEHVNGAVQLNLGTLQSCVPRLNNAADGALPENDDFDISALVGLDLINTHLRNLTNAGKLNFCTQPDEQLNCSKGHELKFQQPPRLEWNAEQKSLQIVIDEATADSYSFSARTNVEPQVCHGGHVCFVSKNTDVKARNMLVRMLGFNEVVGKAVDTATAQVNESGGIPGPLGMSFRRVGASQNGVRMDWNFP